MKLSSHRGMDLNERVFNYQLSHMGRVVNAFWILAIRFLVLQSTMQQELKAIVQINYTCVVLQNFRDQIRKRTIHSGNHGFDPGQSVAREPAALWGKCSGRL